MKHYNLQIHPWIKLSTFCLLMNRFNVFLIHYNSLHHCLEHCLHRHVLYSPVAPPHVFILKSSSVFGYASKCLSLFNASILYFCATYCFRFLVSSTVFRCLYRGDEGILRANHVLPRWRNNLKAHKSTFSV